VQVLCFQSKEPSFLLLMSNQSG